MHLTIEQSELMEGLDRAGVARLQAVATTRSLAEGEYLFTLGEPANEIYVVLDGRIDICFPFSFRGEIRDIAIETKLPGHALGWSAYVQPHRFTRSARAAEPSEVAVFSREELNRRLHEDCQLGLEFTQRIAEIVAGRLLRMQALWARELQRALPRGVAGTPLGEKDPVR